MTFEPIAIVGEGCVLPGALSPEALWTGIMEGRSLLSEPDFSAWRMNEQRARTGLDGAQWSLTAGYVKGFEAVFDPHGYAVPGEELLQLDRMIHWMLHAAKEALSSAGIDSSSLDGHRRTGAIVGNLSLPTLSMAHYTEAEWLRRQGGSWLSEAAVRQTVGTSPAAINRFMSGYPAHLLAKALGLGGGAFCLDAACASSLYAIKLACDKLHDGEVDLMLAGAVNGAEPLFLHTGFRALQAISPTGQSRPFHSEADGLVPAEGCGFVALKRLNDAIRDGNPVLGVIRGIGLSNDGGQSGLLSPSAAGQVAAMRQAYEQSGLSPSDISLIECHATGTLLGDATEIRSMSEVFAGLSGIPMGSVKSNLGHPITAAGVTGLIKVLGSMKANVLPPSLFGETPIAALEHSPFRLLRQQEAWRIGSGSRRAAINSFGFGGNNAHLIVEQYDPDTAKQANRPLPQERLVIREEAETDDRLAIVGIGALVGDGSETLAFSAALFAFDPSGTGREITSKRADNLILPIAGTTTPPSDLKKALPQQLQLLRAAKEAAAAAGNLPAERTGIFVGMQCDAEIARHGARLRVEDWLPEWLASETTCNEEWVERVRQSFFPALDAPTVVGLLPNIPANRLNKQLKISGPGFTVSSEELSGITALEIASRALRTHELDAAIVGAVDMSCESVHELAAAQLAGGTAFPPGDAAVVLVLKRLKDAVADQNTIYAILPAKEERDNEPDLLLGEGGMRLEPHFGKAHAANGLLHVAAGALALHRGRYPVIGGSDPLPGASKVPESVRVEVAALGGASGSATLLAYDGEQPQALPKSSEVPRPQPSITVEAHRPSVVLPALPMRPAVQASRAAAAAALEMPLILKSSPMRRPTGPSFTRAQLEVLAAGSISAVFGPAFADQDRYRRQVRMPEPPLLLADRVTGIEGEPHSMGRGTMWTETDVRHSRSYMHKGRMPFGIMIESGQADLLLISWLGIDRFNRGERVYRLLGCELTFHGSLPKHGETLTYQIEVDSHAKLGDTRLFFFHYDCFTGDERRMTMRQGQAGFFTDAELANSGGVIWDAAKANPRSEVRLDPPEVACTRSSFTYEQVKRFAEGRAYECFGPGYEWAETHTSSPSIQSGDMLFLQEVTGFDPQGGPWGRGYLRAETALTGSEWFFPCHFNEDPVMPGTLMLEGCVQAISFYMAAMGFTMKRDGWRFEPVPDVPYRMECRGQVTPASRKLVYEVFVVEVSLHPVPTVFADVLFTVDGMKAFRCGGLGIRLVPDFPLETAHELQPNPAVTADERAVWAGGIRHDYNALLACAWGRPSDAFGPFYASYDNGQRTARLPGPPYHFMTRITAIEGEIGVPHVGCMVEAEYDIPPDAWYFDANGCRTMPYCVLMEAALQPCGWLACFVGIPESREREVFFRNLDGQGTQSREVAPTSGTLRTRATMTKLSRMGNTYIESFEVLCYLPDSDEPIYTLSTVFGHFTEADLVKQVGITGGEAEGALQQASQVSSLHVELTDYPAAYFNGHLKLPRDRLLMIDQVSGYWPHAGKQGLGRLRAEKRVVPGEWFFKAHFYRDPVQPGSLGVEAIVQLLQFYMLHNGMDKGMIGNPKFEPIAIGEPTVWKYRGQVTPNNERITIEMEILEVGADSRGAYAFAEAWLIVDGVVIYYVSRLGMRIVGDGEEWLDPEREVWLRDHCPTYTAPALPASFMLERMAAAVLASNPGMALTNAADVTYKRWIVCDSPQRVKVQVRPVPGLAGVFDAMLLYWREASRKELSRFEEAASGRFFLQEANASGGPYELEPELMEELIRPRDCLDPYASGGLFHGPAFHILKQLTIGDNGGSAILTADSPLIPIRCLHPMLLDGITHVIPHDALSQWCSEISDSEIGYPYSMTDMLFRGRAPHEGEIRCEVRFDGMEHRMGQPLRFAAFRVRLYAGSQLWCSARLVEVLLPKGRLGAGAALERTKFLMDRQYVEGFGLSRREGLAAVVTAREIKQSDWFPGTVASVYGLPRNVTPTPAEIASKDHAAALARVHPSAVILAADGKCAFVEHRPYEKYSLTLEPLKNEAGALVSGDQSVLDLAAAKAFWRSKLQVGPWLMEQLYEGLTRKFVRHFTVTAPEQMERLKGRPALYLANHQTAIESLLFAFLAGAYTQTPVRAIAKKEHQDSWIGRLLAQASDYPGIRFEQPMVLFDRTDQTSMLEIAESLLAEMKTDPVSLLVHVEGTRSQRAGEPVRTLSSLWIDLALKGGLPIIPVRFIGGLPSEALQGRLEFPNEFGSQDYVLGQPIFPEELEPLSLLDRKQRILEAINLTGLPPDQETAHEGDAAFAAAVERLRREWNLSPEHAVLLQSLAELPKDTEDKEEAQLLLEALAGESVLPDNAVGRWLAGLASSFIQPDDRR